MLNEDESSYEMDLPRFEKVIIEAEEILSESNPSAFVGYGRQRAVRWHEFLEESAPNEEAARRWMLI